MNLIFSSHPFSISLLTLSAACVCVQLISELFLWFSSSFSESLLWNKREFLTEAETFSAHSDVFSVESASAHVFTLTLFTVTCCWSADTRSAACSQAQGEKGQNQFWLNVYLGDDDKTVNWRWSTAASLPLKSFTVACIVQVMLSEKISVSCVSAFNLLHETPLKCHLHDFWCVFSLQKLINRSSVLLGFSYPSCCLIFYTVQMQYRCRWKSLPRLTV